MWLALLAFGAVLTLTRTQPSKKLLQRLNPFLISFFVLAAASILWSIEPAITLRRVIRASTILLDAMALGLAVSNPKAFQLVLRPVLTALLTGSILFVLVEPKLAIEQSTAMEMRDAWHGLTLHKNSLGSLSAITFVLWWHAFLSKERNPLISLIGVAISATCLVGSRSSTSLMATAFAAFLMVLLLRSPASLRRYLPYVVGIFITVLLVYSLAVLNLIPGSEVLLSPIALITGKDQTFSGRTPIWNILNAHIAYAPWLGSGYGAYWNMLPESPSMQMLQQLYFYPTEGHNGYLDVINDLGFFGGVVLVGYLVAFLRQGLAIFKLLRPQGALYLCLLFEQLIGNLSESRWFNTLSFDFVIMTIATVAMGKTLLEIYPGSRPRVQK
jgi:O-antigen ligase